MAQASHVVEVGRVHTADAATCVNESPRVVALSRHLPWCRNSDCNFSTYVFPGFDVVLFVAELQGLLDT